MGTRMLHCSKMVPSKGEESKTTQVAFVQETSRAWHLLLNKQLGFCTWFLNSENKIAFSCVTNIVAYQVELGMGQILPVSLNPLHIVDFPSDRWQRSDIEYAHEDKGEGREGGSQRERRRKEKVGWWMGGDGDEERKREREKKRGMLEFYDRHFAFGYAI